MLTLCSGEFIGTALAAISNTIGSNFDFRLITNYLISRTDVTIGNAKTVIKVMCESSFNLSYTSLHFKIEQVTVLGIQHVLALSKKKTKRYGSVDTIALNRLNKLVPLIANKKHTSTFFIPPGFPSNEQCLANLCLLVLLKLGLMLPALFFCSCLKT